MRYRAREKDVRRIGYVFEDDPLQETPTSMTAIENWKSVMTELNEKKIKNRELCNPTPKKNIDSSFDSGIQQEYNSDNDEVCNSICMTLNKLVELSKEQQIYLRSSDTVNTSSNDSRIRHGNEYPENTLNKNIDCLSIQSSSSETNNLVEEMIMKNSCATENATENVPTVLGRYADSSPSNAAYRYLSRSTQNLSTINDSNADNSFQSLPIKRNYVKNTIQSKTALQSVKSNAEVIIAIDIGTTFSGFAYTMEDSPSSNVHNMKSIKDPSMKKLPSILLLNSRTEFHSFGYDAKDYFLSIEQRASSLSSQWLLFEKFKLQMLNFAEIDRECEIKATNGVCIPALTVYTRTLNYFKCLALLEISNALQKPIKKDQIRWVITIPVMWSVKGKLFVQEAAYNAGLCSMDSKDRLTIVYEPEAVASWCNTFGWSKFSDYGQSVDSDSDYIMVMNCGGGLVDVTVHQANEKCISTISEVHKSNETIYSSHHINEEFLQLLLLIFGNKFVNSLKSEKPASLIDLLYQFEFCKCFLSKNTNNTTSANLFISRYIADFYKKITGKQMNETVTNFSHEDVSWSDHGAICIKANLLQRLFQPLVQKIIKLIKQILQNRSEKKMISRIYIVGGLTKSHIFQETLRDGLEDAVSLIFIQNESELCVLKGAVQKAVTDTSKCYKIPHSYAVGVMKQFQEDLHPIEKMVSKDGRKWCCDLLDWLYKKDQILQEGEVILKRYTPTTSYQSCIIINVYIVEHDDSKFVTDNGVHNCGALRLSTSPTGRTTQHEILLQLIYNGNEFIANALDTVTGHCTQTKLDNLSYL